MNLAKKYTMYLIHHSHTDIGYTQRPEYTIKKQVRYIRDILGYIDQIVEGSKPEWSEFKWVCETFVIVDTFLKNASEIEIEKFVKYVKMGYIGLSGAYANMAELVSPKIMNNMIKKSQDFAKEHGLEIHCGMQADVNGLALGYAEALAENGIKNYYACVHTHHGMFPDFKKHSGFRWELPSGKKLLVWNGEHYMYGNMFAFCKGAIGQYGFNDNLDFEKYNKSDGNGWMEITKARIDIYIKQLKKDGWDKDYITQCIHGKFTDNSMPNPNISSRVQEWNQVYGDQFFVKTCTLEEYFEILDKETDLPTYSGEWPDWWTDGIGSAPREVKIYKNSQTRYEKILKLDINNIIPKEKKDSIEHDLTMFSEHTFGSWDSIHNPHNSFAHEQWASKQWYCFNALRNIDEIEFEVMQSLGDQSEAFDLASKFIIKNPNSTRLRQRVVMPFQEADELMLTGNYKITDSNGKEYDFDIVHGNFPTIDVDIESNQELIIHVEVLDYVAKSQTLQPGYSRIQIGGSDLVEDLFISEHHTSVLDKGHSITQTSVETNYLKIQWNNEGIISWFDKVLNKEFIDEYRNHNAFSPVHEVTNTVPRNKLGRNRKGIDVQRSVGSVISTNILQENKFNVLIALSFNVAGCEEYLLKLNIDKHSSRVDVKTVVDKKLVSNPENLYISLPFIFDRNKADIHFGKGGSISKPWKDQLPGTLIDFYSVFEGICINDNDSGIIITTPDTQLIQCGDLNFKDRVLFGEEQIKNETMQLYVWAMNNIWETNFLKNLANFYEFSFTVQTSVEYADHSFAINTCDSYNKGLVSYSIS